MREIKERSSENTPHEQDLRGLGTIQERLGPYGLLSIQHSESIEALVTTLAGSFSCKVRGKTADNRIEVVANILEDGSHKEQVLKLFAIASVLLLKGTNASMALLTPRFSAPYDIPSSQNALALTDETFHILRQSGLPVESLQLTTTDVSKFVEQSAKPQERKYA